MSAVRILLADDHRLLRAGIKSLLESTGAFEVIAEAENGREAVRLAKALKPDVAMLDIAMPELNGLDAARRLAAECPEVRVLILSMHADEGYVREAMQGGAAGYVLKDADVEELEFAIRAVMRGERYLAPRVSKYVIEGYVRGLEQSGPGAALTRRQREILQLVAEGCTTREIAERLHISVKTVETHRAQLMDRLDIHDVAGLTRYAIRIGLVSGER
jgi:DNA-binding NarL/FixJ family response regulator